ncbi:uncharacterized protein NPIL_463301 [Nephila pilipes]|uniref:Uncharacterized protein n=1 Tax=Nephila pilipes TaxID=299642 RepID=A0A8X6NPI7_NEPPI|nr:uncharacterized protein NPIL_463301 [Nephila pilipes]
MTLPAPLNPQTVRSRGQHRRFCVRALDTIIDERPMRSLKYFCAKKWTPAGPYFDQAEVVNAKGKQTKRSKPSVVWDCGQSSGLNVSTGPNSPGIPWANSVAYASSTLPHFSLAVTGVEGIRFGTRSPISSVFLVIPNSTLFAASFSSYFYLSILLVPNITSLDVSPHAA